jgi:hypothetical protein
MIERRPGGRGKRPLHQSRRLVGSTLSEAHDTEQMERRCVLWGQSKGATERLLGLVQPPGFFMSLGEADKLGEAIHGSGWRRRVKRRCGVRMRFSRTSRVQIRSARTIGGRLIHINKSCAKLTTLHALPRDLAAAMSHVDNDARDFTIFDNLLYTNRWVMAGGGSGASIRRMNASTV